MSTTAPPPPIPPKSPSRPQPSQILTTTTTTPTIPKNPNPTHQPKLTNHSDNRNRNSSPPPLRPRPISPIRNHSSSPIHKPGRLRDHLQKPSLARKKSRGVLRHAFGSLRFGGKGKGKGKGKEKDSVTSLKRVGSGEEGIGVDVDVDNEGLGSLGGVVQKVNGDDLGSGGRVGNDCGRDNGEGSYRNMPDHHPQHVKSPYATTQTSQHQHTDNAHAIRLLSQHLKPAQNSFKDFLRPSGASGVNAENLKNTHHVTSSAPKVDEFVVLVHFTPKIPSRPASSTSAISNYDRVSTPNNSPPPTSPTRLLAPMDALILVTAHTTFGELIEKIHEVYSDNLFGFDIEAASGLNLNMLGIEEIRCWFSLVVGGGRQSKMNLKVCGENEMKRVWRFMEMGEWWRGDWIEVVLVEMGVEGEVKESKKKEKGKERERTNEQRFRDWLMEQHMKERVKADEELFRDWVAEQELHNAKDSTFIDSFLKAQEEKDKTRKEKKEREKRNGELGDWQMEPEPESSSFDRLVKGEEKVVETFQGLDWLVEEEEKDKRNSRE